MNSSIMPRALRRLPLLLAGLFVAGALGAGLVSEAQTPAPLLAPDDAGRALLRKLAGGSDLHREPGAASSTFPVATRRPAALLPVVASGTASPTRRAAQKDNRQAQTQTAIAELKQRGQYDSLQAAMQQAFYAFEPAKAGGFAADNPAQRYASAFQAGGVQITPMQRRPDDAPGKPGCSPRRAGAGRTNAMPMPEPAGLAAGNRASAPGLNTLAPSSAAPAMRRAAFLPTERARVPRQAMPPASPLTFRLAGLSRGGRATSVRDAVPVRSGSRIVYRRGAVTEWYENRPQGLEQGFTLDRRPAGAGTFVTLSLAVAGAKSVRQAGQTVTLTTADGRALSYQQLAARDAVGRKLPARLHVGGQTIALTVDDRAARYPLTIDPLLVGAGPKVTASDPASGDYFGLSVSVSGDTALVGAYGKTVNGLQYAGVVYVFVRTGGVWSQQTELTAANGAANDYFGYAVSVSGDTALIGARGRTVNGLQYAGAAYVFVRTSGVWTQQQQLTASDPAQGDQFGVSVSVSGDTALIGPYYKTVNGLQYAGAAYVFVRTSGVWTQQQQLTASDPAQGDQFGVSVSVSGDTALVGADGATVNGLQYAGTAYVFVRTGGVWSQQQKLTASDPAQSDRFGISVSVSGDTALVGAEYKTVNVAVAGAAYVYTRTGGVWSRQQKLTASEPAYNNVFGYSVSVSGDTALVGAYGKTVNGVPEAGAAYVFVRRGGVWTQQTEWTASDPASGDYFGLSVSVSGDTALVGACRKTVNGVQIAGAAYFYHVGPEVTANDPATTDEFGYSVSVSGDTALVSADNAAGGAGAAYVFVRNAGGWTLQQKLIANDPAARDYFGASASLSGDTALIGANGKNGHGVVYVFVRSNGAWTQQAQLTAGDAAPGDNFGFTVSLSGDTALVGTYGKTVNTALSAGAAYVFVRTGGVWTQQAELTAANGAANDYFGYAVSVSGDTALVGAYGSSSNTGAAYVFVRSANAWGLQQTLTSGGVAGDQFGFSVSVNADTALVGANGQNSGAGAAYVFVRSANAWTFQQALTPADTAANDQYGFAVSLSGDLALVGAYGKNSGTGAAYLFSRNGTAWTPQQTFTASDGAPGDYLGRSVSLSGDTVAASAIHKTVNGVYNAGAAYLNGDGLRSSPDRYSVYSGTAYATDLTSGVLANDADPQGLALTARLFKAPAQGSLTLNPDGTFTYTANAGYSGVDSFLYQARNSNGALSEPTLVTFNVIAVATDVTTQVKITRSGFRRNPVTGRFAQTVTLQNISTSPIAGPLSLVFDSLTSNATLYHPAGTTSATTPQNSPYLNSAGGLAAGASVTLTVEFADPPNTAIGYVPRVLAGPGAR